MQNTNNSKEHPKTIEKIMFKFIWKGKDRIKREVLMKDHADWRSENFVHLLNKLTIKFKQKMLIT